MSDRPDDPLAGLRAGLRAGDRRRALAELDGLPTLTHPGARRLARALARVRAELLRFEEGGPAALRAWLAAAPDEPAAWWRLVVQRARAGDADGVARGLAALERTARSPGAALLGRAAWATVVGLGLRAPRRALEGLAEVSWSGPPEALAAAWRALALVRAAEPSVAREAVEEAVAAAQVAGGERSWCDVATLRAAVAAAGRSAGRAWAEDVGAEVVEETGSWGHVAEDRVEAGGAAVVSSGQVEAVGVEEAGETGSLGQVEAGGEEVAGETGSLRQVEGDMSGGAAAGDAGAGDGGLAWFLAQIGAGTAMALPWGLEPAPEDEARGEIAAVLADMAGETGGIRAPGTPPSSAAAREACALAEAELEKLGLALPVRGARGGPDGGVTIRNDREPGLVVHPSFAGLPGPERRFRVALAVTLIRAGLAIVLDPQAASLPELLAALRSLADPAAKPGLPGARTIRRTLRARGWTAERLAPERREALVRELDRWGRDRASVARLAHLLRRDALVAAARLSGALGGGLLAIARDARLVPAGGAEAAAGAEAAGGVAAARAVLATDEARALLREAGLVAENPEAR